MYTVVEYESLLKIGGHLALPQQLLYTGAPEQRALTRANCELAVKQWPITLSFSSCFLTIHITTLQKDMIMQCLDCKTAHKTLWDCGKSGSL